MGRDERGGWGTLAAIFAASGVLTLGEGSLALLLPPLLDARGVDAALIGGVLSAYGVAALASRIPAGALYRSDRAAALVGAGCLLTAVAFVLIPLTQQTWLVAVLVAFDGFGFGVATTGAMAAIMDRRPPGSSSGAIMAWYAGGTGLGYAAAGLVGGSLGDVFGVGTAIMLLAVVPVIASAVLTAVLRGAGGRARAGTASAGSPAAGLRVGLRAFRELPGAVWVGFCVALYLNLTYGVVNTFFPIHGLTIGLSLTQIGLLVGIHSTIAAAIRFLSGPIFRAVSYERMLTAMVLLSGTAIAGIGMVSAFGLLAIAWGAVGLARGLLRVASGALVMDASAASDSGRGASSSTYLAGLDLGRIIGPLVGGVTVGLVGIPATFLIVAVVGPTVYLLLVATVRHQVA